MGLPARWVLEREDSNGVYLRDVGPWDKHLTVTNDVENVVDKIAPFLNGRRLFYFDSNGDLDEIIVVDGHFGGFRVLVK